MRSYTIPRKFPWVGRVGLGFCGVVVLAGSGVAQKAPPYSAEEEALADLRALAALKQARSVRQEAADERWKAILSAGKPDREERGGKRSETDAPSHLIRPSHLIQLSKAESEPDPASEGEAGSEVASESEAEGGWQIGSSLETGRSQEMEPEAAPPTEEAIAQGVARQAGEELETQVESPEDAAARSGNREPIQLATLERGEGKEKVLAEDNPTTLKSLPARTGPPSRVTARTRRDPSVRKPPSRASTRSRLVRPQSQPPTLANTDKSAGKRREPFRRIGARGRYR